MKNISPPHHKSVDKSATQPLPDCKSNSLACSYQQRGSMSFPMKLPTGEIRDFLDWLGRELISVLEAALSRMGKGRGFRPHGRIWTMASARLQKEAQSRRKRNFEKESVQALKRRSSIVLEDRFLKLPLATKNLPFSRAMAVAAALARQNTPFALHEIYILPVPNSNPDVSSSFYIVKKKILDSVLTEYQSEKINLRRLGLRDNNGIQWIPPRAIETIHPAFFHIRCWRNRLLAAFSILLISCGITYEHVFFKYSAAEQELAAILDVKRGEALQVRKFLDQQQKSVAAVAAARKGKIQSVPVVLIWEELTRILPDDAWLTDVAVNDDTLTINGFATQSAASLIATLNTSALFSEPAFISPVVRIPNQAGERFEIRLRVRTT